MRKETNGNGGRGQSSRDAHRESASAADQTGAAGHVGGDAQKSTAGGSQRKRGEGQATNDAHGEGASTAQKTGAVGQKNAEAHDAVAGRSQTKRGGGQKRGDSHASRASAARETGAVGQSSPDVHERHADGSQQMRGGGQEMFDAQKYDASAALPTIQQICNALKLYQRKRVWAIKTLGRQENGTIHLVAGFCGYETWEDKPIRDKKFAQARNIIETTLTTIKKEVKLQEELSLSNKINIIEKLQGKLSFHDIEVVKNLLDEIDILRLVRNPLILNRKHVEKHMRLLASRLPVFKWADSIRGFGALGLAVIVGEAGNLSKYPEPPEPGKPRPAGTGVAKLWKRLGLAPYKGKAMSCWPAKALTKEEWKEAKYNPHRLAEVFSCVTSPLLKNQGGTKGREKGPYRKIYDDRRAKTADELAHPDWTKKHSNNDAMRIMTKCLIRDLWVKWREAGSEVTPIPEVPRAKKSKATK
jgi:hypothetical protein